MDKLVNQNVNLVSPLTVVIFDWFWPKRPHCQIYHIFLARSQGSCALEEKNLQMPGAMSGRGWVMIRVPTSYLHMAVLIGREFDKRRNIKLLYNIYS